MISCVQTINSSTSCAHETQLIITNATVHIFLSLPLCVFSFCCLLLPFSHHIKVWNAGKRCALYAHFFFKNIFSAASTYHHIISTLRSDNVIPTAISLRCVARVYSIENIRFYVKFEQLKWVSNGELCVIDLR